MQRNEMTSEEYKNRGNTHYTQGNYPAAIADYSKAIELNPQYEGANSNLNVLLKKSRADIFESIKKCPNEEAFHLLKQALNAETPLGKRFLKEEEPSQGTVENNFLQMLKELYTTVTIDRVSVRRAARLIAQGQRSEFISPFNSQFNFLMYYQTK